MCTQSCPTHNRNFATAFLLGQSGILAISCFHGFWDNFVSSSRLYTLWNTCFKCFFIPSLCHLFSLLRILLTLFLLSYIPAFLVPSSSLPSVLTDLYTPVLSFVCILSFPSFSVSIPFSVSYQHSFFCTSSSIYILFFFCTSSPIYMLFTCQSNYYFCASLFICFSFLSLFSLLTSSPHSIRLYSCLFLFFFCLCQSLPLYPPTTHVSSCGNVSICIRKVPSSNLCQNTIYQDGEKTVNLPGCRRCKQLSSPMWHVVIF
jgi:hypothetical protein